MHAEALDKKPYYQWLVFCSVAIGTFMATLDGSIVNVALPTISEQFSVDLPVLQWVVSAYLLTISSLLPTLGRLADMYGRSKIFSYGFLVFITGSLCCGLSSSVGVLVASRIIQAVGAAMMMANSMAIVTDTFPPQMRGRALGTMGSVVAAGSITGPSLGGILISRYGWPAIFFVNLPIGMIGFVVGMLILPKDKGQRKELFDIIGAVLFALGMICLLLGLSLTDTFGWGSYQVILLLIAALGLLAYFVRWELCFPFPMIDLSLFQNRIFAAGNGAGLISFVAIFSVNILMPFYLQQILQLEPHFVGLMMTPFPVAMAVFAPVSGWLSDKMGPAALTVAGMLLGALNIFSMTLLTSSTSIGSVAVRLAVMGLAMSLFQSPNNSAVLGSVPKAKLGVSGGIVATVRNIGMVLGIALSVSIFSSREAAYLAQGATTAGAFMHGFKIAMFTAAVICAGGAVMSLVRGKRPEESKGSKASTDRFNGQGK